MSKMRFQIREMQPDDAEQLQRIYQSFVSGYVGPSAREFKVFRLMASKRDNLRWVALDTQGKIVGYISSTYAKGRKQGRINEIVVESNYDFETVARPLVDKIYKIFLEKGAASIYVHTIRNPQYAKIFPKLGFLSLETDGVFMIVVHNVPRFLHEITPILARRLERLQNWKGWLQLNCEEHSVFLRKSDEKVQSFIWTNREVNLQIFLDAKVLADLLLGVLTLQEAIEERKMRVETASPRNRTNKLLTTLFPKRQFLAFDFW